MKTIQLLSILFFSLVGQQQLLAQTDKGFALVELFTSEGCSSCPPADRLVAAVQKEYAGQNVYVVAYHVDYWNRLGWKDPFSSHIWSQRQQDYASTLGLSTVYTPQVLVNGQTEFVGSDSRKLHDAIRTTLATTSTNNIVLQAPAVQNQVVEIAYAVSGNIQGKQLMLAIVQKDALTQVKAGENAGASLKHINIVRVLKSIPLNGRPAGHAKLEILAGLTPKDYVIVGFVQRIGTGAISGATKLAML